MTLHQFGRAFFGRIPYDVTDRCLASSCAARVIVTTNMSARRNVITRALDMLGRRRMSNFFSIFKRDRSLISVRPNMGTRFVVIVPFQETYLEEFL